MFTDDINLYGKHAQYVKELASQEVRLFNRNLDVFMNAAIVGLIYNTREERDRDSQYKDVQTNILASAINKEKTNLDYIYRLIMILDESEELTLEEKVNRAFRDDSNSDVSDKHQKNLDLFKAYVLGGVSILYDKIVSDGIEIDDFMKNAFEFMKSRSEVVADGSADDLINTL